MVLGAAIVAVVSSVVTYQLTTVPAPSRSAQAVQRCQYSQLTTATGQTVGAGGTDAFTILILNAGHFSCSLTGFADLAFYNESMATLRVRTLHISSMLFKEPKPRRVVLKPGGTASFAISYSEESTPPRDTFRTCAATGVGATLPTRSVQEGPYDSPIYIDACTGGHAVELTPIEAGVRPEIQ
jgi:hypothetical protein